MTAFYRPSAAARGLVRRYTEGNMSALIVVLRGNLGELNPATGLVGGLVDATTVYRGLARIRPVGQPQAVDLGGGEIAQRDTVISIPMEAAVPRRDDLIRVLDGDSDSNLNTRIFRCLGADGGGLFGDARRLSAAGWFQSRYWGKR